MHVVSAACDAAADKFSVVLEIHCKDLFSTFFAADLAYTVIHVLTLLFRRKQFYGSLISNRHVMEIPGVTAALVDNHIKELVRCNGFDIFACIAD